MSATLANGHNHLLDKLPGRSRSAVLDAAEATRFAPGESVDGDALVLPLAGVFSLRAASDGEPGIEMAMIGSEGMIGWHGLQGCAPPPYRVVAMVPGMALRLNLTRLAPEAHADLAAFAAPYVQTIGVQISHCALAAARRTVVERLARWLLMCFDRLDGSNDVALTHEALSATLGVRRPGVTVATHELEGIHAIRARRGTIRLLDRSLLESAVRGCYGAPEREWERLFGPARAHGASAPHASHRMAVTSNGLAAA